MRQGTGMKASACARKFTLRLRLLSTSCIFEQFNTQLQWHDSVHLSPIYIDYSFSS